VREERAAAEACESAARLSFDGSVEGERLRRFQLSCGRSLLRTLDILLKIRRADFVPDSPAEGEPPPIGSAGAAPGEGEPAGAAPGSEFGLDPTVLERLRLLQPLLELALECNAAPADPAPGADLPALEDSTPADGPTEPADPTAG